jgi:hypothetical protein
MPEATPGAVARHQQAGCQKLEAYGAQVLRAGNGRVGAHPSNSDIAQNNRSLQDSATFSIFIWHL